MLEVQLLHPDAQPPARTRPGDAGFDLRGVEPFTLAPGERRVVPTGVAVALPDGVAGLVVPRSGLAARHGISVVNGPGLIDPTYRGEIRVVLVNLGQGAATRARRATASRSSCSSRSSPRARDAAAVGRRACALGLPGPLGAPSAGGASCAYRLRSHPRHSHPNPPPTQPPLTFAGQPRTPAAAVAAAASTTTRNGARAPDEDRRDADAPAAGRRSRYAPSPP